MTKEMVSRDELARLKTYTAVDLAAAVKERCSSMPDDILLFVEEAVAISSPTCAAALALLQPRFRCVAIVLSLVLAESSFEVIVGSKPSRRAKFQETCMLLGVDYALVTQLTICESAILHAAKTALG